MQRAKENADRRTWESLKARYKGLVSATHAASQDPKEAAALVSRFDSQKKVPLWLLTPYGIPPWPVAVQLDDYTKNKPEEYVLGKALREKHRNPLLVFPISLISSELIPCPSIFSSVPGTKLERGICPTNLFSFCAIRNRGDHYFCFHFPLAAHVSDHILLTD